MRNPCHRAASAMGGRRLRKPVFSIPVPTSGTDGRRKQRKDRPAKVAARGPLNPFLTEPG
jgi:hypothetical protein